MQKLATPCKRIIRRKNCAWSPPEMGTFMYTEFPGYKQISTLTLLHSVGSTRALLERHNPLRHSERRLRSYSFPRQANSALVCGRPQWRRSIGRGDRTVPKQRLTQHSDRNRRVSFRQKPTPHNRSMHYRSRALGTCHRPDALSNLWQWVHSPWNRRRNTPSLPPPRWSLCSNGTNGTTPLAPS
jgi:hypothetical protein